MGIDAEILVRRVPTKAVNDEWLKALSFELCTAIGTQHFFISDGLRPMEYATANKAWHEAFNKHHLHSEWSAAASGRNYDAQRTLHARILADVGKPPTQQRLAIDRAGARYISYREEGEDHNEPGERYDQDGDPIYAEPGECLLELSLSGRFYGESYERGDLLAYCAIAEWLEINIPGCEVWYGGDSSGVLARPFTSDRRNELKRHLFSRSGRDYFKRGWMRDQAHPMPPACSLCPRGQYCGSQYGAGGNYAAFHCSGCGKSCSSRDGGVTWQAEKDA